MGDKWTMRQRGESSAVSADPKKVVAELAKFQERLHGVAHAIFDEAKESDKGVQLVVKRQMAKNIHDISNILEDILNGKRLEDIIEEGADDGDGK